MAAGNGDSGDWDVDEFLDGYRRRTKTVTIYQRGDLVDQHAQLEAKLVSLGGQAKDGDEPVIRDLLAEIQRVEAELEGSGRTFHVEACGHDEWYRLMAANPPTDAERKEMPGAAVGKTFQAHAVVRCVTTPSLTVDQVRKLRKSLRPDDFDRLWLAVVECVEGQVEAPKSGLATAVASLFDGSSTSPANRAQRRRSSSGGNAGRSRSTTTTRKAG